MTDRRTDGRTDTIAMGRAALHTMQRGKNTNANILVTGYPSMGRNDIRGGQVEPSSSGWGFTGPSRVVGALQGLSQVDGTPRSLHQVFGAPRACQVVRLYTGPHQLVGGSTGPIKYLGLHGASVKWVKFHKRCQGAGLHGPHQACSYGLVRANQLDPQQRLECQQNAALLRQ